ncbi:MAG: NADH-quinone oxidoreductase subunit L [Micavibrio sp.]|nr:MAG: NADH-quinone oxidoreductase subunit L [Micavibrio sp.]
MEEYAVILPLLGAIIAGFFGRMIGDRAAQFITCTFMILAAFISIDIFRQVAIGGNSLYIHMFTWIQSGTLDVSWGIRLDTLSAVMLVVVNVVSAAVHVYSVGYMDHDKCKARFMAYLSLFTFAMLMLVTADNLLQLFFGWEGVGLASYLLIGFWNHKHSANAAAVKAFVVNRIGDFGLVLGLLTVFVIFGTLDFDAIFSVAEDAAHIMFTFMGWEIHALTLACGLLFIGAMGKSAQLGLHTWLPDAMEGPTPVSALIHAATMVTAGVFLVARMSPLFEYAPAVLAAVAVIGALTALLAATIALTQFDIKRVIAYSTMSQLGYMFFALGVSAYGAAIFHLFTHAFFKALLFLGAGSVIHAMSDEQDMRKMGGIWKKIPVTYLMMWIGSLALAGIPFFAGYYSKDLILEAAFAADSPAGLFAFWCGVLAAFLTAFYSWRLIFMTFHGKPRADEKVMAHIHESPSIMRLPLYVLAAGSVFAGAFYAKYFVGDQREAFWLDSLFVLPENDTVAAAHHVPGWVALLPIVIALSGILLAFLFYVVLKSLPQKFAESFRPLHSLFYRKWFFDEIYHLFVVRPVLWLGRIFWKKGDEGIIDRFGPDGIAKTVDAGGGKIARLQTGYIYHYAFAMLIGIAALIGIYLYKSFG